MKRAKTEAAIADVLSIWFKTEERLLTREFEHWGFLHLAVQTWLSLVTRCDAIPLLQGGIHLHQPSGRQQWVRQHPRFFCFSSGQSARDTAPMMLCPFLFPRPIRRGREGQGNRTHSITEGKVRARESETRGRAVGVRVALPGKGSQCGGTMTLWGHGRLGKLLRSSLSSAIYLMQDESWP